MISPTASLATPSIVLDVTSSNWAAYKKQSYRLFQTNFGRIGASIISGIRPTAFVLPSRNDVDPTGEYTYNHQINIEPITLPLTFSDLTPIGYDMLRDSIKRALDQHKVDEKDDYDLLTHIFSTMSSESHLSLETRPSYPTFRATPSTQKSFECWALLSVLSAQNTRRRTDGSTSKRSTYVSSS